MKLPYGIKWDIVKNRCFKRNSILILTAGFFPQNNPRSFRATELAKEFARLGHKVVIYVPTQDFDYTLVEDQYGFKVKDLGKLPFNSISITGSKFSRLLRRFISRFLLMFFEFPNLQLVFLARRILKYERGYDLLISNAAPHAIHWGVASAWDKSRSIAKTWIAECGDPYMGNRIDSFRKLWYFKFVEKWMFKKADFITVPSSEHIKYYFSEFLPKIKVIPQGFSFNDVHLYKGIIKNQIPTFGFAGRFLEKLRDPRPFLDYLSTIQADFRFVIFSPSNDLLISYKEKLGKRLVLKGFIPREKLLYELSKMDFLVHIEFHSSVESNAPSKFADYLIARRPILSLNMESLNKEKIVNFLNGNYKEQMIIKDSDRYRIENVAQQFLDLIDN